MSKQEKGESPSKKKKKIKVLEKYFCRTSEPNCFEIIYVEKHCRKGLYETTDILIREGCVMQKFYEHNYPEFEEMQEVPEELFTKLQQLLSDATAQMRRLFVTDKKDTCNFFTYYGSYYLEDKPISTTKEEQEKEIIRYAFVSYMAVGQGSRITLSLMPGISRCYPGNLDNLEPAIKQAKSVEAEARTLLAQYISKDTENCCEKE